MPSNKISIIECPRDAMQGWHQFIPTAKKIEYINLLLQIGFHTIDFGSFVSPKAIPQMADTKEVLKGLKFKNTQSKLLAIVANVRGAKETVLFDEILYLGFPFSISETFQLRNTNSNIKESLERVDEIQELCIKDNKELVVYLSMAFGNPYGDEYNESILLQYADEMFKREIKIISLADTVGIASSEQIEWALNTLIPKYVNNIFGVHLHASSKNIHTKLKAAIKAGCTRFDGALKGIGGCPMAQDNLVGNMNTEIMLEYFEREKLIDHINHDALQDALKLANEIFI